MNLRHISVSVCLALASSLLLASVASAQSTPDPPTLTVVSAGHGKVRLTVTAGPSGAPDGFEVCWMTAAQFASFGGVWPPPWVPGEGWDDFTGVGTLNTFDGSDVDFHLGPNLSLDIEVGDTFDETGVSGTSNSELMGATQYVFCTYAIGPLGGAPSPISSTFGCGTSGQGWHCTYSFGYWKTHQSLWPVGSLTLGTHSYTQAQLIQILQTSVKGNGLVSLAHQLIAAKINIANGSNPAHIASAVTSADGLIGGLIVPPIGSGFLTPHQTGSLTQSLDDYNNDEDDNDHCTKNPVHVSTWGDLKSRYH
jgi:hypothetical protein